MTTIDIIVSGLFIATFVTMVSAILSPFFADHEANQPEEPQQDD